MISLWLERRFLKKTFDEEVSCDIEEIRRLLDADLTDEGGESYG